jgi:hypothetical protein
MLEECYHDEVPGEKRLPGVEADWPPEAFAKACFMCQKPLHPGEEAKRGMCTACRRRSESPVVTTVRAAELRDHYTDEAFLDATAEPLPGCFDLWPAGLQFSFVWRREEFDAVRRARGR